MSGGCGLSGIFNHLSIQQLTYAGTGGSAPCQKIFWNVVLYYDLPVYRNIYRLILKIFEYTRDFPREYQYSLGQTLKQDSLRVYNFAIYGDC